MPIQNTMYNKIVWRTEGARASEKERVKHFERVANRYLSLWYDIVQKSDEISQLSSEIEHREFYEKDASRQIVCRKFLEALLARSRDKKNLQERTFERTFSSVSDVYLLEEKINAAYYKKDGMLFFQSLKRTLYDGVLWGTLLWSVNVLINFTDITFERILHSWPVASLLALGFAFIYNMQKNDVATSKLGEAYEKAIAFAKSLRVKVGNNQR